MPATDFAGITRELSIGHTHACENILTAILVRHYGSVLWVSAQDALVMLEQDGLELLKIIHPSPRPAEFVLKRLPKTEIGQVMDERLVLDRVTATDAFQHRVVFPGLHRHFL